MINFVFFWPNNLGFPHCMGVKRGLRSFINFKKGRKILTLFTFGSPNNNIFAVIQQDKRMKLLPWATMLHQQLSLIFT